jgi:hypothetical protein
MNQSKEIGKKASSRIKTAGQKTGSTVRSVLDGSILLKEQILGSIPFLIFLTFIGVLLIANTYITESSSRKVEQLTKEITELRIRHKLIKSDLMYLTNQSEVTRRLATRGLLPSTVPPMRIKRENDSKGFFGKIFN